MKTKSIVLVILITLIIFLSFSQFEVKAESNTIVVPDDYTTIHEAVENANNGDTIFVKKGYYESPQNHILTINKSISIIGEVASQSRIILHPTWVSVNILHQNISYYTNPLEINTKNVNLVNLTINADGGMIIAEGENTKIRGCILNLGISAKGKKTQIINNLLTGGSIFVGGKNQFIAQNTFRVNGGGILVTGSNNTIALNKIFYGNGNGIIVENVQNIIYGNTITDQEESAILLRYDAQSNIVAQNNITNSEHGIYNRRGANNTIFSNTISNCNYGLRVGWGSNNLFFENNVISNDIGVLIGNNQSTESRERYGPMANQNRLYRNNFINNSIFGIDWNWLGTNYWDNRTRAIQWSDDYEIEGNHWSNYNGTDGNNDGLGDSPYEINETARDYFPLIQKVEKKSTFLIEIPAIELTYDIPEFPSWIILPMSVLISIAVIFSKNRLIKHNKTEKQKENS